MAIHLTCHYTYRNMTLQLHESPPHLCLYTGNRRHDHKNILNLHRYPRNRLF